MVDRKYGKPPTLFGRTIVHMQKKAETYQYFSSSLVSLNADLSNVLAIGSDKDVALRKGFSSSFPIATMVYCNGHVEQDICRKLRDLGVDQYPSFLFSFANFVVLKKRAIIVMSQRRVASKQGLRLFHIHSTVRLQSPQLENSL